jgi:hypothetical protein
MPIPEHMQEHLDAYVEEHRQVGGFLISVLTNDLVGAVKRADAENLLALPDYVKWLYWNAPSRCWGSPEKVKAWLEGEKR